MEKYRKFLPVFIIVNFALFVDNFSTYLCFYYIPEVQEANPITAILIKKLGLLLGLIIHQIMSMFLFAFAIVILVSGSKRYYFNLDSKFLLLLFLFLLRELFYFILTQPRTIL